MNKADKGQTIAKVRGNRGRRLLFKIIAILSPFLILFLIEISLRIFNYGDDYSLFIEAENKPGFLVLNPSASKKYFVGQAFAPTGNSELFKKVKDDSTLRIFVLGESTTIGYPYFHNGSFHRWLLFRLMHEYPDKQFEIINLSMTAVNSYTVLGFARELINYQPDAVLIYSGHNEYYGTLGVCSTSRIGSNSKIIEFILQLRRLRIVQLFYRLFDRLKHSSAGKEGGQSLMQKMVAEQQIPYGSTLYKKGVEQFVSNMDQTLNLFNQHEIPVFISSLVSNEDDMKPFISILPDSVKYPEFNHIYKQGVAAFEGEDLDKANQYLISANKVYSGHALCNYYLGKIAYHQGNFRQAKAYFILAKDMDGLRFRAPTAINDAVKNMIFKYKFAHLVDSKSDFDSMSVNHIIGNELLLEHVHPNLKGYAIISNAFYESLKREKIISQAGQTQMSFEKLEQSMPVTVMDSLLGVFRIYKLKRSWPFNEVMNNDSAKIETIEEKLANEVINENRLWPDAVDKMYDYYLEKQDYKKTKTIMESLVLEHPTETYFYDKTANLCGKLGNYEDAAFYFKRAFAIAPSFESARKLFVIYLKIDKPSEAMPYIDYVIQNNASNLNFLPVKKYTEEIINLQKQMAKDSSNISIMTMIASAYSNMGNKEGALKYAGKILKADPKNKEVLPILEQIKKG